MARAVGTLLAVLGGGAALLGVANCASAFMTEVNSGSPDEGIQLAALVVNLMLFIFPGLVLLGIGIGLRTLASRKQPDAGEQ